MSQAPDPANGDDRPNPWAAPGATDAPIADPKLAGAIPNPRAAKTLGVFNVVFGSALMLCSLSTGAYVIAMPMMAQGMKADEAENRKFAEAKKAADLAELDNRAKTATTDQEKAAIVAERAVIEARRPATVPFGMDWERMGLTDPKLIAWSWAELLTALLLNGLMLASGVGLVSLSPWGRRLATGVYWAKIARLVLVYGIWIVVVVPPMSEKLGGAVSEMIAQQQPPGGGGPRSQPPPPELFARVYGIMYSVGGVGMIVLGAIFPAVGLVVLNKPGVRKALAGPAEKPVGDGGDFP